MSKRKARALAAGAVLVLYIVSMAVLAAGSLRESQLVCDKILNAEYAALQNAVSSADNKRKMIEAIYAFTAEHRTFDIPVCAAVFEPDGTLVAKTGSYLCVNDPSSDGKYYIPQEEFMTAELTRRLAEFCEVQKTDDLSVKCIWFSHTPDGIELRRIRFGSLPPTPEKSRTWEYGYCDHIFSDEPYDDYLVEGAQVCFYHCTPGGKMTAHEIGAEEELRRETEYRKRNPIDTSAQTFPEFFPCRNGEQIVYCGDFPYVLYFRYADMPVKILLKHSGFIGSSVVFSAVFVILLVAAVCIADWLFEKNRRMDRSRYAFISAAAHELKTPVSVISAECECALDGAPSGEQSDALLSVYEEAGRMNEKIKELLEYNRMLSGGVSEKRPEDIHAIARAEIEKACAAAEKKGITVFDRVPENTLIRCRGRLISSVLENFLSNAVKYAPENAVITVTAEKSGKYTVVSVYNTGSRIDAEDMPHIWEELYRGDKVRNSGDNSSGLGLSICRTILEAEGFSYGAENTADGVTFFFRAPAVKQKRNKRAPSEKKKRPCIFVLSPAELCALSIPVCFVLFLAGVYLPSLFDFRGGGYVLFYGMPVVFAVGTVLYFFFLIFSRITQKEVGRRPILRVGWISALCIAILAGLFFLGILTGFIRP